MERQDLDMLLKNDKKYTILVSGASGIVGYGILRCLRERGDCFLIGTTIYPESPANCFSDVVEIVPKTDDLGYIDYLIGLIHQYSVDMMIPAIEADMSAWNEHRGQLEATGVFALLNNPELINLCLDKWKFFKKLEKNNYQGRILSSLDHDYNHFSAPFILKPRCGYGARGLVKVESERQYNAYIDEIGSNLMVQELVGTDDEEYTVSVFFDEDSKIKAIMGLKRKLAKAGYTEIAEVIDTMSFVEDITLLAKILKPVGPTNFQFRRHEGKLKLLEINPRISSSTSIRCKFGYNESKMAVDYFLENKEISQPVTKKGRAVRYTEDFIFYDSDNI
ncbi:MAG: ATP-grasp domain-containing protein [Odoribacter sp.]|nr:ATP-grasp domain-containing protein [Odoribacter sp.]